MGLKIDADFELIHPFRSPWAEIELSMSVIHAVLYSPNAGTGFWSNLVTFWDISVTSRGFFFFFFKFSIHEEKKLKSAISIKLCSIVSSEYPRKQTDRRLKKTQKQTNKLVCELSDKRTKLRYGAFVIKKVMSQKIGFTDFLRI